MIEQRNHLRQLPKGWAWARIGDFSQVLGGKRLPKGHKFSESPTAYPYLRVTDFDKMTTNTEQLQYLKPETHELIKNYTISKDDVYISIAGSIGKVGIIPESLDGANLTENAARITLPPGINKKALSFILSTPLVQDQIKKSIVSTNQPKLALFRIEKVVVPIPPTLEQGRIVVRLEELFACLDAGVEGLQKVKAQLKRYRQAVLKYAFEGKLTEEWRKTHREQIEPAAELVDGTKLKPPYLQPPFELPKEWMWDRLGLYSNVITKGESPNWQGFDYVDIGVSFIRSENVLWGAVELENVVGIPIGFHNKLKRSQVKAGDVLINLVGASIGRCGIVPSCVETANINQAVALIRVNDALLSSYLMYLLISPKMQGIIHANKVETARPNISLQDLRQLVIPLPSLAEHREIIEEVEHRFSLIDKTEEAIGNGIRQPDRMRQSLLKVAFEGKLVAQDPSDEPAERVLERIEEERTKRESVTVRKKRRNKPIQSDLFSYVK